MGTPDTVVIDERRLGVLSVKKRQVGEFSVLPQARAEVADR
jgi:hypothetical protein